MPMAYFRPVDVKMTDTYSELMILGHNFPVYVCLRLPGQEKLLTPIMAVATDFMLDSERHETYLGT